MKDSTFPSTPRRRPALAVLVAVPLLLQGCALMRPPATPAPGAASLAAVAPATAAAANAAPSSATTPPRPDPSAPKPFAEVIKGAMQLDGFLPLWRKDERLWIEVPPALLENPFLLSVNVSHSVGERGLYGSQMGPSWLATFRRVGISQMQLIARNTQFVATNPALQKAVEQAFADSLLASTTIASAPHPERKSVLIDASFLLGDISGYSSSIERAFRMPYGLDRGNSFFEKTRATDDLTTVQTRLHYATARLPQPPAVPSATAPTPPVNTPDARSFFVGLVYNFMQLPAQPMAPRETDPRLGHFFDTVSDLSDDLQANPRQHFLNRWRLEKQDPAAQVSEPKQPIVYWLDKNIPPKYRAAVSAGILEWNKAFERLGYRNAIVVKQQDDDADWDTMDSRHASVRWFVGSDVGFARGPNHSDPRTGEILDADIAMSDVFGRGARRFIVEDVGPTPLPRSPAVGVSRHGHDAFCDYTEEAAREMDFALDLLEARGDIAPNGPEAEAFVQGVIKDTVMHEVGHTLGLKHNFKGSTSVTRLQLQDLAFTESKGISGSVMDYNAYNLALTGERQGAINNSTLGPYDYWAIEYAYKPIDPATEKAELKRIAASSNEPGLAYGDDTDAGSGFEGIDPLINRFDLGDDPLAYYEKRLMLSRELWQRVQSRPPQPDDDAVRQRRVLLGGFRQVARASELVGKYVGGMYTSRDLPGSTGTARRAAFTPVEPARQRDALQFLARGLFNADSFRFRPEFLSSLAPDYNEWTRPGLVSIPAAVLQVQSVALDRLMNAGTASRLLDLPLYVPATQRRDIISLGEVYGTLQGAIWGELKSGREIDRLRRNLQREHLKRVQGLLTSGASSLPPDALSLVRYRAAELQHELRGAVANPALSIESRAHLQDSLSLLTTALNASMVRD